MGKRHRQDNSSGESSRAVEGGDRATGRNPEELALVHPKATCEASPTGAHYYVKISKNGIFRCKHCWTPCWFPAEFGEAMRYSIRIKTYGLAEAYRRALSKKPKVVEALNYLLYVQKYKNQKIPETEIIQIANALAGGKKRDEAEGDIVIKGHIARREVI